MQINENFYGGSEYSRLWQYDIHETTYNVREALNGESDTGFELPLNEEWDTSIAPWAINKNADILGLSMPFAYYSNGVANAVSIPLIKQENNGTPIYFARPYISGNSGSSLQYIGRNAYAQSYIQETSKTRPRNNYSIIRDFDYSKLAYYVSLKVANYNINDGNIDRYSISDTTTYELPDYFANYETLKNKPILQISLSPFYKTGTNPNNVNFRAALPDFNINTLARFNTIAEGFEAIGENIGALSSDVVYTNEYLDYAMTIMPQGNGIGYIFNGEDYSNQRLFIANVTSYAECANANYTLGAMLNNNIVPLVPSTKDTKWKIAVNNNYAAMGYAIFRSELSSLDFANADELREYILKQVAYLGVWFCVRSTSLYSKEGSDDNWYLGEIDENGVTTGNYRQGAATSELSNSEWQNPWDSSGWKGRDDDPTDYDKNQTSNIISTYGDPAYNSKEYLMSENALSQLIRVLNEFKLNVSGELANDYVVKAFGDTDPVASIISVIKYPFDIIHNFNGNGSDVVLTGSNIGSFFSIANASIPVSVSPELPETPTLYTIDLTSNSEIYEIDWTNTNFKYGTAKIPYYDKFKCFLDYEPYCTANLYIPFCGSVKIDPELFCGHEIGVDYIVSPIDGTTKAFIKRDNLIIDTLTGNIGTKIEINSADDLLKSNNIQQLNATIQAQKMNTAKKWSNVAIGAVGGAVVSGGVGAVVGGIASAVNATFDTAQNNLSIEQKQMQIDNAETPFKQLQSGGGYLSQCDEYAIRLVVYRPETLPTYTFDNWGDYGKMRGFATYETGTLNNYSGYVECSNILLDDISATDSEKKQIFELLKGGVIL